MIKTIVFDLGNVLFRLHVMRGVERLVKASNDRRLTSNDIARFFQTSPVERAYTEGKVSSRDFYRHACDQLGLACTFDEFADMYCDIFSSIDESHALARQIKARGYRLMVLSNTNELHFDYLAGQSDWLSVFDDCILSYKEFCQKPDPAFYTAMIRRAQCRPEEIFFTDDLMENIEGAKKMGIVAVPFTDVAALVSVMKQYGISV